MKIQNLVRKISAAAIIAAFAMFSCFGSRVSATAVSGCKGSITISSNCSAGCYKGDTFDVGVMSSDSSEDLRNLKVSWSVNDSTAISVTPEGYSASLKIWNASVKILKAGTHKYGAKGTDPTVYAEVNGVKLSKAFFVYPNDASGTSGYVCDTTNNFSVKQGATYQFMVTSAEKPSFICGSKTFHVVSSFNDGDKYYFKVKSTGCKGSACGFYINGSAKPAVIATIT